MKKSRNAEDVPAGFPSDVQDLAREARRLLLKLLPDAEETVDPTAAVLRYGCGRLSRHDLHGALEKISL
jgi:regulator of sirC expression with transglutaminase-like and TPR domain